LYKKWYENYNGIFLSLIKNLFNKQIIDVQGSDIQINYIGFVLSYVCVIGLLYYFIIKEKKDSKDAFILGILSYGDHKKKLCFFLWANRLLKKHSFFNKAISL